MTCLTEPLKAEKTNLNLTDGLCLSINSGDVITEIDSLLIAMYLFLPKWYLPTRISNRRNFLAMAGHRFLDFSSSPVRVRLHNLVPKLNDWQPPIGERGIFPDWNFRTGGPANVLTASLRDITERGNLYVTSTELFGPLNPKPPAF